MNRSEKSVISTDELYGYVAGFIRYGRELKVVDADLQERVSGIFKSVALQTCLPVPDVLFDDKGVVSLGFSDEDRATFKELFEQRWPVVEDAFEKGGKVFSAVSEPEWSDYIGDNDPEKMGFEEIEKLHKAYSLEHGFWCEAQFTAANILGPVQKEWQEQNRAYDFSSLARGKFDFYDICRGAYQPAS